VFSESHIIEPFLPVQWLIILSWCSNLDAILLLESTVIPFPSSPLNNFMGRQNFQHILINLCANCIYDFVCVCVCACARACVCVHVCACARAHAHIQSKHIKCMSGFYINVSSKIFTLWYTIYDIYELLHVSARRCHPQVVITKVYKPTCQSRSCSYL
jgi:hypothetical protein